MSKSKSLNLAALDDDALEVVCGGGETLSNATWRYGTRRSEDAFAAVLGEDFNAWKVADYGFAGFLGTMVVGTGAGLVGRGIGSVEGAVRWATGTTDYVERPNMPTANPNDESYGSDPAM